MFLLVATVVCGLIVLACSMFQNHCTAGLLKCFENGHGPSLDSESSLQESSVEPQAVVILCLRGSDPQLKDCVSGLLKQDYDNWQLRIVVDHADDPAFHVLETCLSDSQRANVSVRILETRYETCSLKLSALSQELARLDDECEAVVLVDADVVTYPGWLKDMLTPLQHSEVGAAMGLRWFAPPGGSTGACMRHVWNLGAIGQMHQFRVAWGGSLAMKTSFVRSAELSRQWSQMAFEDTALVNSLKEAELQLRVVPQAVMVNTESTTVAGCMRYIQRQMLNARLYHPAWKSIFGFGFLSTAGAVGAMAALCGAALTSNWTAFALLLGMLGMSGASLALYTVRLESSVRRTLERRSSQHVDSAFLTSLMHVFPVQLLYGLTLLAALKQKTIDWRGIRYQIEMSPGSCRIRMKEYRPMGPSQEPLTSII